MRQGFVIRRSPFVFLKRVFVIETLLAFIPIFLAAILNAQGSYDETGLAEAVSYPVLQATLIAVAQTLIIGLSFLSWYVPTYHVDRDRIVYRRGGLFEERVLANTQAIVHIAEQHGPLGRRLDYGTLVISTSDRRDKGFLRDIPVPSQYARQIEAMIEPELARVALPEPKPAHELIAAGESQGVEFKASLVWDYRRQSANKDLYEPVMKNVAAFMNTTGGTLLIGVGDEGEILGLENDFRTMRKQNVDGFENTFTMAFNKLIGVEFSQFVDVSFPRLEDQVICMVAVRPAPQPVYLAFKGQEQFYIRAGNSAQPLTISQAARYIRTHFTYTPT